MMKLNRALTAQALPEPSPASIAASVRRAAALQAGEFQLAELRVERAQLFDAVRAAIAAKDGLNDSAANREIAALVARRREIEAATDSLRRKIA